MWSTLVVGQSSVLAQQGNTKNTTSLSLDLNSLLFEVHLTGDIPYTGMFRVPPGTRVDELISTTYEAWKLKESQILISPKGLPDATQDIPEDAFVTVLNSELDLRNIRIQKRNGNTVFADLIGYRLGGLLESNPVLEQGDVINVRKLSTDPFYVSVSGAVQTEITIPFGNGDTALKLLQIAGSRSSIASENELTVYRMRSVERYSPDLATGETQADPILTYTLSDEQLADFSLKPGDRIVVPVNQDKRTIHHATISGEVARPGAYPIIEGVTTLSDLLRMAGGPTEHALLNGIEITRPTDSEFEYKIVEGDFQPLPDIFRVSDQFEESRLLLQNQILMGNNVIYADLSGMVDNEGNWITEKSSPLPAVFNSEFPLLNKDEILIPKDQKTIRIMGQIGIPGFYPFNSEFTYQEYIELANGLGPAADSSRIFVIKAATNNWVPAQETTLSSGDILFIDSRPIGSYVLAQDLEIRKIDLDLRRQLQENDKKRVNLQIIVSVVNVSVSLITTYLLIQRQ